MTALLIGTAPLTIESEVCNMRLPHFDGRAIRTFTRASTAGSTLAAKSTFVMMFS
jgi:hypothetical protein